MNNSVPPPSHIGVNNDGRIIRLTGMDSGGRIDMTLTPLAALGLAEALIAAASLNLQHKD